MTAILTDFPVYPSGSLHTVLQFMPYPSGLVGRVNEGYSAHQAAHPGAELCLHRGRGAFVRLPIQSVSLCSAYHVSIHMTENSPWHKGTCGGHVQIPLRKGLAGCQL